MNPSSPICRDWWRARTAGTSAASASCLTPSTKLKPSEPEALGDPGESTGEAGFAPAVADSRREENGTKDDDEEESDGPFSKKKVRTVDLREAWIRST
jgi:hypothetical protein